MNPIEVMDEIGCYIRADSKVLLIFPDEWQSLRAAIEAQAAELARCRNMAAQLYQAAGAYDMPERVLDVLSDMASGDPLRHKNILPTMGSMA